MLLLYPHRPRLTALARRATGRPRLALALVLAASLALPLAWVFLVPVYQAPDEHQHLDLVLAFAEHRGLFRAHHRKVTDLPGLAHPYTFYLMKRCAVLPPESKAPPGYGTAAFFAALDRHAPPRDAGRDTPPNMLLMIYPFGYYRLVGYWVAAVRLVSDRLTVQVFSARAFSVLLLAATLLFSYGTARRLNYRPGGALLLTAAVGLFPMTTFVTASVQPDNLAFTLVSLVFYLALRARQRPGRAGAFALLGLALGTLLVTKVHFYVCVLLPVLGMLAADWFAAPRPRPRLVRPLVLLAVPSLVLGGIYAWTVWDCENYYANCGRLVAPGLEWSYLHYVLSALTRAAADYYAGTTHDSFWGVFGTMNIALVVHDRNVTALLRFVIQAAAWVMLGLTLVRLEQVVSRLARLVRRGRGKQALRIACSNVPVNSYFLFTALMFALYVRVNGQFGPQGRNWLPFLLPFFMVGVTYAPKALTLRRGRAVIAACVAGGVLLYDGAGSLYALKTLHDRFYFPRALATQAPRPGRPPDIFVTGAGAGGRPEVSVFDAATGQRKSHFLAFAREFKGGVRVAAGDVNGDGTPDVICAAGSGGPRVRIFDGATGRPLAGPLGDFLADEQGPDGAFVAAGDVDGDGYADVVVAPDRGSPTVTVYSGKDGGVLYRFLPFGERFTGGARVAVGDVNGDGYGDVLCGAGPGGAPGVAVYSGKDGTRFLGLYAFDRRFGGGIYVTAGDLDGDGCDDIICSADIGGGPTVSAFSGKTGQTFLGFFVYLPSYTEGIRVAAADVTGDGRDDLLVVSGRKGIPGIKVYDATDVDLIDFIQGPRAGRGLYVAGSRLRMARR